MIQSYCPLQKKKQSNLLFKKSDSHKKPKRKLQTLEESPFLDFIKGTHYCQTGKFEVF